VVGSLGRMPSILDSIRFSRVVNVARSHLRSVMAGLRSIASGRRVSDVRSNTGPSRTNIRSPQAIGSPSISEQGDAGGLARGVREAGAQNGRSDQGVPFHPAPHPKLTIRTPGAIPPSERTVDSAPGDVAHKHLARRAAVGSGDHMSASRGMVANSVLRAGYTEEVAARSRRAHANLVYSSYIPPTIQRLSFVSQELAAAAVSSVSSRGAGFSNVETTLGGVARQQVPTAPTTSTAAGRFDTLAASGGECTNRAAKAAFQSLRPPTVRAAALNNKSIAAPRLALASGLQGGTITQQSARRALSPATPARTDISVNGSEQRNNSTAQESAPPTQGDVYLDGSLVGRWMARTLAEQAGRPPTGGPAFDPTRSPFPPGRMIGG